MAATKFELFKKYLSVLSGVLLLPLAAIPPDFGSSIFWLIGGFLALHSFLKIFGLIFKKPIDRYAVASKAVVLLVFFISVKSVQVAFENAKEFAKSQSYLIKAQCEKNGKCPETLPGWRVRGDAFACDLEFGVIAKYFIRYRQIEQGSKFEVSVRENIDRSYYVYGGVHENVVFK